MTIVDTVCTLVILVLGRWRQEDQEFKAYVSSIVTKFKASSSSMRPCLKPHRKKKEGRSERKRKREKWREENAVPKCGPLTIDPQNCDSKSLLCVEGFVMVIKNRLIRHDGNQCHSVPVIQQDSSCGTIWKVTNK